jgi:putative iron-only hydrogenase system regulator
MDKRLGFVGIIVEGRKQAAGPVNAILSEFGDIIVARTGIPYAARHVCVITLVVDATTDEMGALTGKLGAVPGVTVKSGVSRRQGVGEERGLREVR